MTNQYRFEEGSLIPVTHAKIDTETWNKIDLFQERIKSLYLSKQEGRYGIKSLGNEIRRDSAINNIFDEISGNSLLVKSTRNRSELEKLHINTMMRCLTEGIETAYYVMFSPELNSESNIFDGTSIVLDNWRESLKLINRLFHQKHQVNFYFIEIESIPGCYFEQDPIMTDFTRIYLS